MTSTTETYLRATTSSHLHLNPDVAGAADALVAAGICSAKSARRDLALRAWRLRASSDMRGAKALADDMAPMVMRLSARGRGRRPGISRVQAVDLALEVLKWWCLQACPACEGRGHPVIPGTPHLDTTRECHHCSGTGVRPMRKYVSNAALAERLVAALDEMSGVVFADMAKKLSRDMDLC